MIILIDNYDSFTWNLWHFLSDLGEEVITVRNNTLTVMEIIKMAPAGIVISPGPGRPEQAGVCEELIKEVAPNIPILGVCLGHQSIATAFGGSLRLVSPPVHGKLSLIEHKNKGIFEGLEQSFSVTRYHSLVVDKQNLPDELEVTAQTADGLIMGLQHRTYHCMGVQFHPESIASVGGYRILANFLSKAGKKIIAETLIKKLEKQTLRLDIRFPEQIHV